MLGGEKIIDGASRLKLSHNPCQWGSVVVKLRFLHAALSVFTIEEVEYVVERLLGIIQHVSECPALTVLNKIVTGDDDSGHFGLPFGRFSALLTFRFCTCRSYTYEYCICNERKGKGYSASGMSASHPRLISGFAAGDSEAIWKLSCWQTTIYDSRGVSRVLGRPAKCPKTRPVKLGKIAASRLLTWGSFPKRPSLVRARTQRTPQRDATSVQTF
jgi:hypothetical protein